MELVDGVDFLSYVRPWYREADGETEVETGARDEATVTDTKRAPPPPNRARSRRPAVPRVTSRGSTKSAYAPGCPASREACSRSTTRTASIAT